MNPIYDLCPDLPPWDRDFVICSEEEVEEMGKRFPESDNKYGGYLPKSGCGLDIIVSKFGTEDRSFIGSSRKVKFRSFPPFVPASQKRDKIIDFRIGITV